MTNLTEYRPNRNFIRVGDTVKCKPTVGKSFKAKVTRIIQHDDGQIEIEVVGGINGHNAFRTFLPERIERIAQTRVEER